MNEEVKKFAKRVRKIYITLRQYKYMRKLKYQIPEDASIFAMNCFGGHFSQSLHRAYNTPTAGLFFFADDFNKIVRDINIIKRPIKFISESKYNIGNQTYPIGVFEGSDIEIHFLHYQNESDALDKWYRRVRRFNFNKWIAVGFCQNLWSLKTIQEFAELEYPNRVLFTNGISIPPHIISCVEFNGLDNSPSAYLKGHIYYKYLTAYLDKYPLNGQNTECNKRDS